jgi:hypothetical protein
MSLLYPRSNPISTLLSASTPKHRPAMVRKKTREAFQTQKHLSQHQPGTGFEVRTFLSFEQYPS